MGDSVDKGHIKGVAFREFVVWFEQNHGRAQIERILELAPPTILDDLDLDREREAWGIVSSRWYPVGPVHRLLDALLATRTDSERTRLAAQGTRAVADRMFTGIYKTLFGMLASPERWAKHSQRLWSVNYDTGDLRIRLLGPNSAESSVSNWPAHHPFLCESLVYSGIAVFEAMGCQHVSGTRLRCIDRGAEACTRLFTWSGAPSPGP
ncbi:MAG: hypothetical protein WKG00_10950 [Polyangiaceae bacterium]